MKYDVSSVQMFHKKRPVLYKPYEQDFKAGNYYESCIRAMDAMGTDKHALFYIDWEDYTIFPFDFGYPQLGNVEVEIEFDKETPRDLVCLVFLETDQCISFDIDGSIKNVAAMNAFKERLHKKRNPAKLNW